MKRLLFLFALLPVLGWGQTKTMILNKIVVKDTLTLKAMKVTSISADAGMVSPSDQVLPTQKAVRDYVNAATATGRIALRAGRPSPLTTYIADVVVDTVGLDSAWVWNASSYRVLLTGGGGGGGTTNLSYITDGVTGTIANDNGSGVVLPEATDLIAGLLTASKKLQYDAKNAGIQFKDEGTNLGTQGTVTAVDVTGAGATASRIGNTVTINVPGGGGSNRLLADEVSGLQTKINLSKSKQKTIKVAWIGDSNSANEYPGGINGLFKDTLYGSFHSVDLRNRSRAGYTLKLHWQTIGVRGSDSLNAGNIVKFAPDIICISLGTNDARTNIGNIDGTGQLDSASYVRYFIDVINYYLDSTTAHIIVMSSAPLGYPALGLITPSDSLSVLGKNAVLRAGTKYLANLVNGRLSVCNGFDFLFPSNYVRSQSTYLFDDLHVTSITVQTMFKAMQHLIAGSYTIPQRMEDWNKVKSTVGKQGEIWRQRPGRLSEGNFVLIHRLSVPTTITNKPLTLDAGRTDRYYISLVGDTSLFNYPTYFQKGDIIRFGNTRAYKLDSIYQAVVNTTNVLLGFFTVAAADNFNYTGYVEIWRDMDFSDQSIPRTPAGFYMATTVPSSLTIGTTPVPTSNLHIQQTTGKVPITVTGNLGGDLVTITGQGVGTSALRLQSNSSQGSAIVSTPTRTDTYRLQGDVRPNFFEHVNSVDSYTMSGVYGRARQNRTTKGIETNLAIGGDFFGSSAITDAGVFGYGVRGVSQTNNITSIYALGSGAGMTANLFEGFNNGATRFAVEPSGACIITSAIWRNIAKTIGSFTGTGTPEGALTASPGSIFQRTDGGAGTTFYTKVTGTGNTGWVPVGVATNLGYTADAVTGTVTNSNGTAAVLPGATDLDAGLLSASDYIALQAAKLVRNGVASGTTDGSGNLVITFSSALPNATYSLNPTVEGATARYCTVISKTTTTATVRVFDSAGAAVTSTAVDVSYIAKDY